MTSVRIPDAVAAVVGDVLGDVYFHHQSLNTLFMEHGAPGDPPAGNCSIKCTEWLRRASADANVDALAVLGGVLRRFMDGERHAANGDSSAHRKRVNDVLARHGLSYREGGTVLGAQAAAPSRTLESALREHDLPSVEREFRRYLDNIETDPAAAATAASSMLEAAFKVHIADRKLSMPSDASIKPLWKVVQADLGLDPSASQDEDVRRVLSGLTSVVDGVGAFRTHVGSAHGRSPGSGTPQPHHVRLVAHAAHTLVVFLIESWSTHQAGGGR